MKEHQVETTARKGDLPLLIQGTTDDIKLNWLADTIRTTQEKPGIGVQQS